MPYAAFENDREYLIRKFRKPVFHSDGMDNDTMLKEIVPYWETLKAQGRSIPEQKSGCFAWICKNMLIDVDPHDYFPGIGCYDRLKRPFSSVLWKLLDAAGQNFFAEVKAELDARNAAGWHNIWIDFDHSVPDWDAIYELGFPGLRERICQYRDKKMQSPDWNEDARAYYAALLETIDAVLDTLDRFINYARAHHPDHPRIAGEIACLEQLKTGAPRTVYEMLMINYLHFIFCEHIDHMQVRSLDNLDRILYPCYKRDVAAGILDEKKFRELMACYLMQWGSFDNYWGHPFYLGGTDENGESVYNELSLIILDVFEKLHIPTPKIQLKIAENTPVEYMNKALDMIRRGNSSLVFVSEESIKRIFLSTGLSEEEARRCNITGCYEFAPRGTANSTGIGHVNLLKPFELIFNGGSDPATGLQMACPFPELDDIRTFGDFFKQYLACVKNITAEIMREALEFEKYLHFINPANMYSLTIQNSLETARDAFSNGSVYNNSSILTVGIGTAVDALMSIKKYVFDRKELTLAEFRDILKNNWEGHEKFRLKVLRSKEKYGNGIPEVDQYAHAISHYLGTLVNMHPNARGGYFKASGHCARQFIVLGEKTMATPDGRKAGEEMSKNLSPTMGMDTNGVTALVRSVTTMDSADLPGDFPLDVMMHPVTVQGEEGLAAMRTLIYTFFRGHGTAIHFNICDAETLIDAQNHPEQYEGLQIRVCGWNVRFNDIAKKEQDVYIERARNIME